MGQTWTGLLALFPSPSLDRMAAMVHIPRIKSQQRVHRGSYKNLINEDTQLKGDVLDLQESISTLSGK
jgi:hypothetical protein